MAFMVTANPRYTSHTEIDTVDSTHDRAVRGIEAVDP